MKLLIDNQIFDKQILGGISKYHSELLKYLNIICKVSHPIIYTKNIYLLKKSKYLFFLSSLRLDKINKINKLIIYLNKKIIFINLKKSNFDIFIPTYYNTNFLNFIGKKPFIVTIHDMTHELFPLYFNNDLSVISKKKLLIEKSTKIIAVSKNTKKDILDIYPHIPSDKIKVIYLDHSIESNFNKERPDFISNKNYILFVGNRENYKNFEWFIKSVSEWILTNNFNIICIGGNKFSLTEINLFKDLCIENCIFQYFVNENILSSFYYNAFAFVFPSEYEGFGIPILEAMACECPVILPKKSSFPEVAGDAGIYFDLNSSISLLYSLNLLLFDLNSRYLFVEKGKLHLKKFSWEKSSSQFYDLCNNIISV
jgi:glycosyltransferase involved in cell wall biosynthesis